MPWFIYLARCRDGSLYTGVSTDPVARIGKHNAGRGAAYTRSRRPVALVYQEQAATRSAALRREHAVKQLSRLEKQAMIRRGSTAQAETAEFAGFRPAALQFFRGLRRRNTREWFEQHRSVYQAEVRIPLQDLVDAVDTRLGRLAPEIVGDPKRSIFRIHRDVRFSPDKSPYKTHAACWFFHRDAGRGVGGAADSGGAGFYFHLAPEECLAGGGIWRPARPALGRIRDAIAQDPESFTRLLSARALRRRFGTLDPEEQLKRLPRGYSAGHPAAPWLRYQSFTFSRELDRREASSPRLPEVLARDFAVLVPLVRWLNLALGYRPADRR